MLCTVTSLHLIIRCIGTTQHLKDKFGKGYVLEIKLKSAQQQSQVNDLVYEVSMSFERFVFSSLFF